MPHPFVKNSTEMCLMERNDPVETLASTNRVASSARRGNYPDSSFGEGHLPEMTEKAPSILRKSNLELDPLLERGLMKVRILVWLVLSFSSSPLFAQTATSRVRGVVTDT